MYIRIRHMYLRSSVLPFLRKLVDDATGISFNAHIQKFSILGVS